MADVAVVEPLLARRIALEGASGGPGKSLEGLLIKEIRSKIQTSPEEALKVMGGKEIPSRELAISIIDRNIGPNNIKLIQGGADQGLKDRTSSPQYEQDFFNDSRKRVESIYDFLEKGVIVPEMRAEVLKTLYNDPGYRTILKEVGTSAGFNIDSFYNSYISNPTSIPPALQKIIDTIIDHPEFNAQLRKIIKNRLDMTKEPIKDFGEDLRKQKDEKEAEKTNIDRQLDESKDGSLAKRLKEIKYELREEGQINGSKNAEDKKIADLSAEMESYQQQLDFLRSQVSETKSLQAQLRAVSSTSPDPNAIKEAETKLSKWESDHGKNFNNAKSNLQISSQQSKALQGQIDARLTKANELESEIGRMNSRLPMVTKEIERIGRELIPYDNDRRFEEQKFIENIRGIFSDTGKEYLDERMARIQTVFVGVNEELKTKEDKEITELIEKKTKVRWFGPSKQGGILISDQIARTFFGEQWRSKSATKRKDTAPIPQEGRFLGGYTKNLFLNTKMVDSDYESLKRGGVKALINVMMRKDVEEIIENKYGVVTLTPDMEKEVEAKLVEITKSDAASLAMVQLLAWRYRGGHIPSEDEAMLFEKRDPGNLKKAFMNNKDFMESLVKLHGDGIIKKLGESDVNQFWEFVMGLIGTASLGKFISIL